MDAASAFAIGISAIYAAFMLRFVWSLKTLNEDHLRKIEKLKSKGENHE